MNETSRLQQIMHAAASLLRGTLLAASATLAIITGSMDSAQAMDTDIFAATNTSTTAPNILIVLDNTSNWSRNDEHFPGGITQGQAEANAIKSAISSLPGHINVGMMEFPTGGRNDTGGYVRFAISPVGTSDAAGSTNRATFSNILTTIYNNITDPREKVNGGFPYGDLMRDAYNYLAGNAAFATSGDVDSGKADSNGYVTNYSQFKSPLSANGSCATTYIIFIGNPNSQGPTPDSAGNLTALRNEPGATSSGTDYTKQLPLPNYSLTSQALSDPLGMSGSCYTSAPSSTTDSAYQSCQSQVAAGTYASCNYSSTTSNALDACAAGTQRYSVIATVPTTTTTSTSSTSYATAPSSSCYASSSNLSASDTGGLTCPANTSVVSGNTTTTTTYSCSYAATTAVTPNTCAPIVSTTSSMAPNGWTSTSTGCYSKVGNGNGQWNTGTNDNGACEANPPNTTNSSGVTTSISYSCTATGGALGATCSPSSGNKVNVTNNLTTTTQTSTPQSKYTVQQTINKTVTVSTTTGGTGQTTLGNTFSCYSSLASCSTSDYTCPAGATCACGNPGTSTGVCPAGTRYQVMGNYTSSQETPTGTFTPDTATYNADEWARFMQEVGVPVGTSKQTVNTYTIDVYNAAPNATQSSLLSSMARNGGGKYFSATSQAAILSALNSIFAEIQAVNNTFASATLPISTTNRNQNSNQVYIGMFRPDQGAHPRWFGNLKRYQVANLAGYEGLAGADNAAAVSNTTGFITPCAVSWWTADTGNYWYDTTNNASRIFITQAISGNAGIAWNPAGSDDNFARGTCATATQWSDLPDGPAVEKGGAAEMLRNYFTARQLYTVPASTTNAATLSTFDTTVTGLSSTPTVNANIAKFIMGQDVTGEIALTPSSSARPSIHGDVIHSRPQPVDYGGSTGVVIYYGAGDGVYHAVQGSTGKELWGFVAPESYPSLQRLMDNSPLVMAPNPAPPNTISVPGTTGRDFFFDGSTNVYQNADNSKVWIYTGMRRGGRMLYAFDVTTPTAPMLKWRRGCLSTDDTTCTTGMTGIGQTWSTPQVAKVNGYASGGTNQPVIIVGGGYDTCEDQDNASPSCSSPKGAAVYVLDADTGVLLNTFTTAAAAAADTKGPAIGRSVAADVTLVDTNGDGIVDAAYLADTGGSIYRIDFPTTALSASDWSMKRVAYTNVTPSNSHRKFLFQPGVLPYKNDVYLAIVSGDREHPLAQSYPYTTPVVNRAYLYLDDPTRTTSTDLDGANLTDAGGATCSSNKVLPGSSFVGWHMDLNSYGPGEQGVTLALMFGGMMTFSTNRPTGSGETCNTSLGEARGYLVNFLNGSGSIGVTGTCGGAISSVFAGGGLPPSAVQATVNVNGRLETIIIGAPAKDGTASSPLSPQNPAVPISGKRNRTYWKINTDNK